MTAVETKTRATLILPSEVYDQYERLSQRERKSLDTVLSERLASCVAHRAQRPIYFTDDLRNQLEQAAGESLGSAEDVIALVRKCLRIKMGKVEIPMQGDLVERLKSRHFGDEREFGRWVARLATEALEEYVGMR